MFSLNRHWQCLTVNGYGRFPACFFWVMGQGKNKPTKRPYQRLTGTPQSVVISLCGSQPTWLLWN